MRRAERRNKMGKKKFLVKRATREKRAADIKKGEYHYMYRAKDDDSHNCETNVT